MLLAVFFFILINPLRLSAQPVVSILIDDIGDNLTNSIQAIELNHNFTYALLPDSQHFQKLSALLSKNNREQILHIPMQSIDSRLVNQNTLNIHMTEYTFTKKLSQYLELNPDIAGINNHMGSLLTMHPGFMHLVMQTLQQYNNLYFIDSVTNIKSIAYATAKQYQIPTLKRNLFLDSSQDPEAIHQQFTSLISLSKQQGYALAICHPYKSTINYLKTAIRELDSQHIDLVPVSDLIKHSTEINNEQSSHSISARL